jgi:hypothetical protein
MTTIPEKQNPFIARRARSRATRMPATTSVVTAPPKPKWRPALTVAVWGGVLLVGLAGAYWLMHLPTSETHRIFKSLSALSQSLDAMDHLAYQTFGADHRWHDVSTEAPPRCVRDWLEARGDIALLEQYNQVAAERNELETRLASLASFNQDLRQGAGSEAPDRNLLLDIERAVQAAERQLEVLQSLEKIPPES